MQGNFRRKVSKSVILSILLIVCTACAAEAKDKEYYIQELNAKYESTYDYGEKAQYSMNFSDDEKLDIKEPLTFTCKESSDGKWSVRVHKKGKRVYKFMMKPGQRVFPCTVTDTGKCYVTVSNLFSYAPEKVKAMLKNYKLHSDPDADKLITFNRKKRKITIRELSPDIYKYLGAFCYNALGVEDNKLYTKVYNNERAKVFFIKDGDKTTRKDYFVRAFFLYCLNNKRLKLEAPQTYSFLERIMKLD